MTMPIIQKAQIFWWSWHMATKGLIRYKIIQKFFVHEIEFEIWEVMS